MNTEQSFNKLLRESRLQNMLWFSYFMLLFSMQVFCLKCFIIFVPYHLFELDQCPDLT